MPTTGAAFGPIFRMRADPYPGDSQLHHKVRFSAAPVTRGSSASPVAAERSALNNAFDPVKVTRSAQLSLSGVTRSDFRNATPTPRGVTRHQELRSKSAPKYRIRVRSSWIRYRTPA